VSVHDVEEKEASRPGERKQVNQRTFGSAASPPVGAVKPLLRPLLPSRFGPTTERQRSSGGLAVDLKFGEET